MESYFLRGVDMAVKTGDSWKVYDVSARLMPSDMLAWDEESVSALVTDPKKPIFIETQPSKPENSVSARTARLALDAEGTVEGDVSESYSGHSAYNHRVGMDGESETRREERWKERITAVFSQAEVTGLKVENAEDPEKPLVVKYHVKIPGYAQRTGKRVFVQPFYFQRGATPLFSASERKFDIHFRYSWKESDDVTIALPEGYELDHAENPGSLSFGKTGSYDLKLQITKDRNFWRSAS